MREIDWLNLENLRAKQEALQFPHRKFEDTMDGRKHTFKDTIAEVKAWEESINDGSWRLIIPGGGPSKPYLGVPRFVRYSEQHEYQLLVEAEYKTEQKAKLALALMLGLGCVDFTESQQLLALLEE